MQALPAVVIAMIIACAVIVFALKRSDSQVRKDADKNHVESNHAYQRYRNFGLLLLVSPLVYFVEKWSSLDTLGLCLLAVPIVLGCLFLFLALKMKKAKESRKITSAE